MWLLLFSPPTAAATITFSSFNCFLLHRNVRPSTAEDLGRLIDHLLVTVSDVLMALRQIEVNRVEDLTISNTG